MNEIDNNKIAMSMLRMCAWLWEHCTRNPQDGEFKINDILNGKGRNAYKSKTGLVFVELSLCKYWDVFNRIEPIEGLTYDPKTGRAVLEIGTFYCSFDLQDVYQVTARFCKLNCPSMASKARFCYKGGERYARLPELPKPKANKSKTTKPKAKATVKPTPAAKPLTLAEQLRQALLARMAA